MKKIQRTHKREKQKGKKDGGEALPYAWGASQKKDVPISRIDEGSAEEIEPRRNGSSLARRVEGKGKAQSAACKKMRAKKKKDSARNRRKSARQREKANGG